MYGILNRVHQGNSRYGTVFLTITADLKKPLQALQVFAKKLILVYSNIDNWTIYFNTNLPTAKPLAIQIYQFNVI